MPDELFPHGPVRHETLGEGDEVSWGRGRVRVRVGVGVGVRVRVRVRGRVRGTSKVKPARSKAGPHLGQG